MSTRPFKATAAFILLVAALFIASPRLPAAPEAPGAKEGKGSKAALQSYTGALKTGVMAIGAETTGYTLTTAADGVYELDFKNPKLKAQADTLDGKTITVEGIYKPRPGVEVKERRIIEVKKLAEAK